MLRTQRPKPPPFSCCSLRMPFAYRPTLAVLVGNSSVPVLRASLSLQFTLYHIFLVLKCQFFFILAAYKALVNVKRNIVAVLIVDVIGFYLVNGNACFCANPCACAVVVVILTVAVSPIMPSDGYEQVAYLYLASAVHLVVGVAKSALAYDCLYQSLFYVVWFFQNSAFNCFLMQG